MFIDQGNMILNDGGLNKKAEEESKEEPKNLEEDIIEFFKDNPSPTDEGENGVHEWAEKNGYDKHDVEEAIYKLTGTYVKFLANGRANEKGITEEDVDPEELKMGIEIEHEHTTDEETAKRIALDHLAEHLDSDYYSRLKQMEEKMTKELGEND